MVVLNHLGPPTRSPDGPKGRDELMASNEPPGDALCEGLTKGGRPCRQKRLPGRFFCAQHDPDLTEDERR